MNAITITFGASETPITVKGIFTRDYIKDPVVIIGGHDVTGLIDVYIIGDILEQARLDFYR